MYFLHGTEGGHDGNVAQTLLSTNRWYVKLLEYTVYMRHLELKTLFCKPTCRWHH